MKKKSKFEGLIDGVDGIEQEVQETSPSNISPPSAMAKSKKKKGKRSNPEYEQITAYIRIDTHKSCKRALMDDEESGDFSDLIETLLEEWLEKRISKNSDT